MIHNNFKNNFSILYFIDDLDNKKSGIYSSLQQTTKILNKNGCNVTVIGMGQAITKDQISWIGRSVPFKKFGPKSINYLPGLNIWLKNNLEKYDIVGIHSLWSFSASVLVNYCLKFNIPFVVTTHGMLHPEALKISKWKKDIAKTIFLSKLFKRASCFHALNQTEYEFIRKFGVKVPISIIGNGIDMSNTNSLIKNFELPFEYNKQKICLYLGRLHPIKGVDRLIDAWISAKITPDWILIIAGSGDIRYEKELKNKAKNNFKNIYFVGYVNESKKSLFYNISTFTVLPSHSEAFPMSVLESFAHKKPVLITSACIFEEALQVNAVMSVKSSKEDIIIGLERFIHLKDSEIIDMGQNGFNLAKNDFSWDIIYNKLCEMYNWMQHRKILPNFIFLK